MKVIFIDTETGGVDPIKHALLSIGLVVWEDGQIIDTTHIFINSGRKAITLTSESINKIDIRAHNEYAVSQKQAITALLDFVTKNFNEPQNIVLAGHNVGFDIAFIKQLFKNYRRSYNKYFSHRSIDTASIIFYLQDCGIIQQTIKSSNDAFKYYNINVNGRHTALGDAVATAELYNRLIITTIHMCSITISGNNTNIHKRK